MIQLSSLSYLLRPRVGSARLFALAACLAGACKSGSRPEEAPRAGAPDAAAAPASARQGLRPVRPLLAEARRAELDLDGLFVDFGSSDEHKYTLGGWRGTWGKSATDPDGTSHATVSARAAAVQLPVDGAEPAIRQIAVRLRALGGPRRLALHVDGVKAGSAAIGTAWTIARIPIAPGLMPAGRRELALVFDRKAAAGAAEVDWLWLGRRWGEPPAQANTRVSPISLGPDPRRALLATAPRRYRFFIDVPASGSLAFDYGGATRFLLRATPEGGPTKVLFDRVGAADRWQEAVLDLGALAGKTLRLDLETAPHGAGGVAGWADPEILVPRRQHEPATGAAPSAPARGVILLVIDTVRADVFKPFNPRSRVKAPAFDLLAGEGTVFVNAYSNENWTKPAVATILSGLYPATHGAKADPDVLSTDVKLLPEHLRGHGFATGAFIANGYCSGKFGFRRGWDHYRNYIRENRPARAEHVFKDALHWLRQHRSRPFFLYLQTIDPHVTYAPPAELVKVYHPERYRGRLGRSVDGYEQAAISSGKRKATDADRRWVRALYDAEVSYHDAQMGAFFAAVRRLGILDQTLVIVTNDHGEEIGERGRYGHGHSLNEELIRAPLLLRYPPAIAARGRNLDVVENVDLFATIVELLGLAPVPELDGLSLLPLLRGRPIHRPMYAVSEFLDAYRAVRVGRWKFIASRNGTGRLYDLAADPAETRDLAAEATIARRMCETHLYEAVATPAKAARFFQARSAPRRFKPGTVELDRGLRRQLEALGYFGGQR